jgi:hypothetical protein
VALSIACSVGIRKLDFNFVPAKILIIVSPSTAYAGPRYNDDGYICSNCLIHRRECAPSDLTIELSPCIGTNAVVRSPSLHRIGDSDLLPRLRDCPPVAEHQNDGLALGLERLQGRTVLPDQGRTEKRNGREPSCLEEKSSSAPFSPIGRLRPVIHSGSFARPSLSIFTKRTFSRSPRASIDYPLFGTQLLPSDAFVSYRSTYTP